MAVAWNQQQGPISITKSIALDDATLLLLKRIEKNEPNATKRKFWLFDLVFVVHSTGPTRVTQQKYTCKKEIE